MGHLLTWLSTVADAVGDIGERELVELAGYWPLEDPTSAWHAVRQPHPSMYDATAAFLDDPGPRVRQEATLRRWCSYESRSWLPIISASPPRRPARVDLGAAS